jgi:acetyl-CoA carboxylase biotin carboxylase subunit
MFESILIANRGEIAVRIVRACRALGIRSVAVYSEADRDALHVRMADEAHLCGPARATESYLAASRIVEIAERARVDAVHPGYGFLSENASFAEAIADAGIVFIGPSPEVIREMGLKVASRDRMIAAGVPVVPGCGEIHDLETARKAAAEIGYPILVKASAGGGGRGMRRVEDEGELPAAIERAASEAAEAFGDGALYLEKLLSNPRHIEIQVMADSAGHVVHLGERECSIQRRHQKLLEEAPAHEMSPERRSAMGDAATRAARSVGYVGAGTCEFLLDAGGDFYFLEMNTRIQVEHPVTEAITGIDLVETQIRVAAGEELRFCQEEIRIDGHAIEARIYAEDPDKGFIPSPGRIEYWSAPSGEGIRLDSGFEGGQTITPHYDPMIAKLIAHGSDRSQALARMAAALDEFTIAGIRTGLPFLRRMMVNATFRAGAYDTGFIEAEMSGGAGPVSSDLRAIVFGAVAVMSARGIDGADDDEGRLEFEVSLPKQGASHVTVLSSRSPCRIELDGEEIAFELSFDSEPPIVATIVRDGSVTRAELLPRKKGGFDIGLRDRVLRVRVARIEA